MEAMERFLVAVAALSLLLSGCTSDDGAKRSEPVASTTTTTTAAGGDKLPGERVEIYPYAGARLAVAGVAADDTLHVRTGPGVEFDVAFDLPPTAMNATATGHNRSIREGSFWSEVSVDGRTGWANSSFLLQPGQTTDVTAALFPTPADRPRAESLDDLGRAVARRRASAEPSSRIVVVDGPTVGDLGEITVDVIGLGDDAQGGERLKIFAQPQSASPRFTVRTVEVTALCSRGVTRDGLCV
jgi:hypothetical protein